ncbi:MAG TPA: lipopolysaccharide transport periplasmic protein LptA [Rhodanobacteraceae bacterium]
MHVRTEFLIALLLTLGVCTAAPAKQSDKSQPINVNANAFAGSQDSGKIVFTGNVTLDQGTFHADGAQATGYTDPNDTSQWQRVVLTGSPAHFQQTQDNGTLVHGQAQTLDYQVSANTVILTGNASVVQQGRGAFHGERLVYDTDTGAIKGTATSGGRVHITLEPRTKPAAAGAKSAPASASSTTTPTSASAPAASSSASAPAVSSSAAPASSAGTAPASAPAPATTSGMH